MLILQKVAIKEQPDGGQQQLGSGETGPAGQAAGGGPGAPSAAHPNVMNNHPQAGAAGGGPLGLAGAGGQSQALQLGPAGADATGQLQGAPAGAVANQAGGQSSVAGSTAGALAATAASQVTSCALKYMVMAGSGEKMLGESNQCPRSPSR